MRCDECGASLPERESCDDRFQALLAADHSHEGEAPLVHDITVATFLVQHPTSRFAGPAWMGPVRLDALREWAATGAPLATIVPRLLAAADRARTALPPPRPGELTIASIDPRAPPGHAERVRAWARSVSRREAPSRPSVRM